MALSVTYTGEEVAFVVACLLRILPALSGDDLEVADLMLDKALSAMPLPLAPDIQKRVDRARAGR